MNHEQFRQFWEQLKSPLQAKWAKITDADLTDVGGNLDTFSSMLQRRYGELQKVDVRTWADRRYCHWSGNYAGGYKDPAPGA